MYTVYVFNHLSRTRNVGKWPKIIKPAVPTYHKLHQNKKSKENSRFYWSEYGSVMCFYFQGSDTCSIIVLYLCITSTSTYGVFQMEEINYKALVFLSMVILLDTKDHTYALHCFKVDQHYLT